MKVKRVLFVGLLCLLFLNLFGQPNRLSPKKYLTDDQLDFKLKKFSSQESGALENSMSIEVTCNDNVFFKQTLNCYTKSSLINDTIYITGYMIGELGWGFQLFIHKDTCIAATFGLSDGSIYKYKKDDTDSMNFILLPNVSQKIVLSKKPKFQSGETVAGNVELVSVPYYYTDLDGGFTINLKAYFRTSALKEKK